MWANLGIVLYFLVGCGFLLYYTAEGWLHGSIGELTVKTAIGATLGIAWGFVLIYFILWAGAEIVYDLYKRKQNGAIA